MLASSFVFFLHLIINISKSLDVFIDPDSGQGSELGTLDNPFKSFHSAITKTVQSQDMIFYFRSERLIILDADFKVGDISWNIVFTTFYYGTEKAPAILQITDEFFLNAVGVKYLGFSKLIITNFFGEKRANHPVFSIFKSKISFSFCDFSLNFSLSKNILLFIRVEQGDLRLENSNISIITDGDPVFAFIGLSLTELSFWKVNIEKSFLRNACFVKDIYNGGSVLNINNSLIFKNTFQENSKAFDNIGAFFFTNIYVFENTFQNGSAFIESQCSLRFFNLISSKFETNKKEDSVGTPWINLKRVEAGGIFLMENVTINLNKGSYSSFIRITLFERVVIANTKIENNTQMLDIFYLNRIGVSNILRNICKGTNNISYINEFNQNQEEGGCFKLVDVNEKKISDLLIIENYGFDHTAGLIIEDSQYISAKISLFNCSFILNKVLFQHASLVGVSFFVDSGQALEIHISKFSLNQLTPALVDIDTLARPGGPCVYSISWKSSLFISSSDFLDNNSKHLCSCVIFFGSFLSVFNSSFVRNQPFITKKDIAEHKKISAFFPSIYDTLISTLGGAISSLGESVFIFACAFIENKAFRGATLFANGKESSSVINVRVVSCLIIGSEGSKAVVLYYSNRFSSLFYQLENSIVMSNLASESSLFFGDLGSAGVKVFIANHTFFYNNTGEFNVFSQFEVSYMKISNCLICFNSAQSKRANYPSSVIINLVCQHPSSKHIFTNNSYYGNKVTSKCGLITISSCIFSTENETFFLNNALNNAGVLFALDRAIIKLINATFLENSASLNGGCIFLSEDANIYINNSTFIRCQAGLKGGALYLRETSNVFIEDSLFEMSRAFTGGVISGLDNKLIVVKNCSFQRNTAVMDLFELKSSLLIINQSKINNPGFNIFIFVSVSCQLNDIKIFNSSCVSMFSGCVLNANEKSNITLFNSIIEITNALTLGGGIYLSSSNISLIKVLITNISSSIDGSCAMAQEKSLILVVDSYLIGFTKYCFYGNEIDIVIRNSIFKVNLDSLISEYKGSIFCSKCSIIEIFNTSFEGGYASMGAAIHVTYSEKPLIILFSVFIANKADSDGGALYVFNSDIYVKYCYFKNNIARRNGGAIYLFSEPFTDFTLNFTYSKFENNIAEREGGAIKWLENQPLVEFCEFFDNKALYGNNIAAFPIRLNLIVYTKNADQNEAQEFDSLSANETAFKKFEKFDFTPGQKFSSKIIFQVVDIYGNIVQSLKDELVDIKLAHLYDSQQYKSYILGGNTMKIEGGMFSLEGVEIFSSINSESMLLISVPSIKKFNEKLLQKTVSHFEINQDGTYKFKIHIFFNNCSNGSVFNYKLISCVECPFNFVSLSPLLQETCVRCSQGAFCPGGATIYTKNGYWLSSNQSIRPLQCTFFKEKNHLVYSYSKKKRNRKNHKILL